MAIYACACLRYAIGGEWGRVAYWACAAGITFSVTFLVGK